MTENKRYVRILDYSEKEVRIFDEHNQKNIFNIFFEGIDSAICLKGALEDTVDLLNELYDENQRWEDLSVEDRTQIERLEEENNQLKQSVNNLKETIIKITIAYQRKYDRNIIDLVHEIHEEDISDLIKELKE